MMKVKSLEKVYLKVINIRKSLFNKLNELRESVDKKLKNILESLESLDLSLDKQSLNYKKSAIIIH